MNGHSTELSMFLIIFGVAVIPPVARMLRAPSAALEICFGALIFNTLLHETPEWFDLLREIGFIYLMFIAGMELDLRWLRRSGRLGWYLLVCFGSFLISPALFHFLGLPIYLGLSVAMISAGIAVPVLKEHNLVKSPMGRDLLGLALTGELLSILVLTFADAYEKHGASVGALIELGKLSLLFGLALVVLKLLHLFAWWHPERIEKVMESEDPVEEGIRVLVTVAFAGGLLAAAAGAEPILGSFLAGMVFAHVFRDRGSFEEKINALGFGFLIPFFFVGVGSQLDLHAVASVSTVLHALGLTLMVFISNSFVMLLGRPFGRSPLEMLGVALLLSAPLSMIVVAGTLGVKMELLSPELNGTLILTALLASVLYPSLFRPIGKRLSAGS